MNRTAEIAAAREADEKIAAAWSLYWAAEAPADAAARQLPDLRKRLKRSQASAADTRVAQWAEAAAQDVLYYEGQIAKLEAKIHEIMEAARPLATAARELDEALYTGWQRFFLVEHIHSSQHCSSFRATTRVGWLPKVSGLTEAEAVAEYGAILCTICFPSAPVEFTSGAKAGQCAGSGAWIDHSLPGRFGYYSGNWATCPECGKRVSVTSRGQKIPKHAA